MLTTIDLLQTRASNSCVTLVAVDRTKIPVTIQFRCPLPYIGKFS